MQLRSPPEGFMNLADIEGLTMEILYGTPDNFTGKALAGYGAQGAWMLTEGALRLRDIAQKIKASNIGLYVWDAYRPRRATLAMISWAESTGNAYLVKEGYIAKRSRHNSGAAIDLSFYELTSGHLLDMGTEWDCFTEASHVSNADGVALENRMWLQRLMRENGFVGYDKEWWHFELQDAHRFALRDVPYGIEEVSEDLSIC